MSYFKAKMHQIQFRLLGELTALPRPLAWFKEPTPKGREGKRGSERTAGVPSTF